MMSEKKIRLQKRQKAGWATAHLPVLGHDTGNCIVTQGWGGRPGRATGGTTLPGWLVEGRCNTVELARRMMLQHGRPRRGASDAHTCMAW